MSNEITRRKNALLESLSLYEQHVGVRGGESILRAVQALQVRLAESIFDEHTNRVDTRTPARAA
jgi:hypothetical protein